MMDPVLAAAARLDISENGGIPTEPAQGMRQSQGHKITPRARE